MSILTNVWVGVDVSKKRLDVSIYPVMEKDFSVTNDIKGIEGLIKKLSKYQLMQMVCESSSYETLMLQMFLKRGLPAWRVEPGRIKAFIRSEGIRSKTDQSDARMMALFASQKNKNYESIALSEEGLQLESLAKRREDLQVMLQAEKTRLLQTFDAFCKKNIQSFITFLEKQIAAIENASDDLIHQNQDWLLKSELLKSVPGVGDVTSTKLIAQLPELGKIQDKQLAALIGLAPYARQSGMWKGKTFISGGRGGIRKILYMAALSAARCNPVLKIFYQKLRDAGKKPKVALIAVARKLLIILNAIIRKSQTWKSTDLPLAN